MHSRQDILFCLFGGVNANGGADPWAHCRAGKKVTVTACVDYPAGLVRTVAGTSQAGIGINGVGASARFYSIQSLALTPDGRTAVVVDSTNIIRRIDMKTRVVNTLAGTADSNSPCEARWVSWATAFSNST